ncbi:bifunctional tRNA (5-methylaminomethyl-2-thiouridine)(34)-methyltransferase MnmD/FAD-dependent 5-carboxymethylaminomethyl-2-thiouridine(34) oxidoreductase MnmC [Celerinatantimonas yamalensis]|uniref:tRNA 5-methylaminomethyl-2-thiouridine biosynthesis bifunctional protein MnmC n=1 Tax=Celerinatantimonas yamalensis TaxID=559956 RepID=A0ABW9G3B5_9GAMM
MVTAIHSAEVQWNEQGLPIAQQFDDVYFSNQDGLAETRYVFLAQNQLPMRWQAHLLTTFVIAESGFGSGLNFLASWHCYNQLAPHLRPNVLHFISFEKYPLQKSDLAQTLRHWPELARYAEQLIAHYPSTFSEGCQRLTFEGGQIILDLWLGDIHESLKQLPQSDQGLVDCWFLDGFAPSKNPQMWSQPLFNAMARLSRNDATFATFTAAGFVRRGLIEAGFHVKKVAGFGRKREMLCGVRSAHHPIPTAAPWFQRPYPQTCEQVGIIGAGIAGASISLALAKRGIAHRLFDQATGPAQGASGNRQGAIYPLLHPEQTALSEFFISAFHYNRQTILQLLDQGYPIRHQFCGVMQLGYNERSCKRIAKITKMGWPNDLATPVDAQTASIQLGLPVEHGGLYYPQAGWACPHDLVNAMLNFAQQQGAADICYQHTLSHWQAQSDGTIKLEFIDKPPQYVKQLILCNGPDVTNFTLAAALPITPVRGQVTHLATNHQLTQLQHVLCYAGYLTPANAGSHCIGATHQRENRDCQLYSDDTQANFAALRQCIKQSWTDKLNTDDSIGRASVRATVRDHLPLMGPLPDLDLLFKDYSLHQAALQQTAPKLPLHQNVYVLAGLGARGVTSAPLLGELIAAELTAAPSPVSQSVLDALHPARFWVRRLLRGQPVLPPNTPQR